ncbi:MAG TPA: helix-turn-helix domain-containing protein [Mycobacterium sp.]|jgi:AcrR family transcriptional regulator
MVRAASNSDAGPPLRADAQRNRAAIIEAAAELLHRQGANASLEEIARRAGVGSATLHRHFRGHRALLEAVFDDRVEQMCAEADRIAEQWPADEALWIWLRHIAQHCVAEKALAALLRNAYGDTAAQNRSFDSLARAGQKLLDGAAAVGALQPGVTLRELLLLVNAVADVCSDNDADIDRLLDLAWNGARQALG